MKNKKFKVGTIVQLCAIGLLGAATIAANVILNVPLPGGNNLSTLITNYLYGSGVNYDNETFKQAVAQSKELNLEIGEEGTVLVRNEDNALPLTQEESKKINVFGWSSTNGGWVCGSDGSANSNAGTSRSKVKDLLTVLNDPEVGMETNKELTKMYEDFCMTRATQNGSLIRALAGNINYYQLTEPTRDYYDHNGENNKTILENAKDFSDVALVVISRLGGEGTDLPYKQIKNDDGKKTDVDSSFVIDESRTYLDVTTEEEALLKMCKENFKKVIVLVNSCNEMNLKFLEDYDIDACLTVNGLGENGTYAIPKILKGEINPSGKTTSTHVYDFNSDPTFLNGGSRTASPNRFTAYLENIYVGYKWYETADTEGCFDMVANQYGNGYEGVVQYPFGYGLSYSNFKWNVESVTATDENGNKINIGGDFVNENTKFEVKVRVTNISDVPGKDIVELYYTPPYYERGIEKASVNLLAFAKTETLEKDQSQVLTLTFTGYDLASYDCYDKNTNRNVGYELDRGEYIFSLRNDSHTIDDCDGATFTYRLPKTVRITNDPITNTRVTNQFTNYEVIAKQEDGSFSTENIPAYANCAIDGTDLEGADWTYLSRANFEETFPKEKASSRNATAIDSAKNYIWNGYDESKIPEYTYGSTATNHLLYTLKDGSKANASQLRSGADVVPNEDLMKELGEDYDNPKWEELLSQLSKEDINNLVNLGGYRTVEIESIGKKLLLENDGPAGMNRHNMEAEKRTDWTMFAMPATLGTSWNTTLAYSFGKSVATEGVAVGVYGWYAPGANMQRSPFGGRNSEYYSEDAILSGKMAASTSKGSTSMGMNTYIKHFAVNDQESNRSGLRTYLTEQTLREVYLKPFELTVKEGNATGMMSSFNFLGASWTGSNHSLMTTILRDEWGFRGTVITDYYDGSIMPVKAGLYGGNDLWLTGGGSVAQNIDFNDKVYMHFARQSAKNILYSNCRAYYLNATRDTSLDTINVDINQAVEREIPFPWWIIWGVLPFDIVMVGGLGLWTYFIFRKKKGPNKLEPNNNSEDTL